MDATTRPPVYTIEIERDPGFFAEAMPMFVRHWEAVEGEGAVGLEFDLAVSRYLEALARKMLVIYTVRRRGMLAGYSMCFVSPALRYQRFLMASNDATWLEPEARRAGMASRLLDFIEKDLRARGVWMYMFGYRAAHGSIARLLQRRGYKESQVAVVKTLQG